MYKCKLVHVHKSVPNLLLLLKSYIIVIISVESYTAIVSKYYLSFWKEGCNHEKIEKKKTT